VRLSSSVGDGRSIELGMKVFGILVQRGRAVGEEGLVNEGIDKSGSSTARSAWISESSRKDEKRRKSVQAKVSRWTLGPSSRTKGMGRVG
jgi:hypothetical protein